MIKFVISLLCLICFLILILWFLKRENIILFNLWRLLLIVSMFLLWQFSKFFEFFEKNFRVRSSKFLINKKFSLLLLCVSLVMFKSSRRFWISLKSWFLLVDFLSSRRFRIFRRVFLLICFLKSRRFLIFCFSLIRFRTILAKFFFASILRVRRLSFFEKFSKKIPRFFQFFS